MDTTAPPTPEALRELARMTAWPYEEWLYAARLLGHEQAALWPAVVKLTETGLYSPSAAAVSAELVANPDPGHWRP